MYGVEGILLGAFVGDTVGCMDGKKVGGGVPGLGGQGSITTTGQRRASPSRPPSSTSATVLSLLSAAASTD